jgi:O-antigen/teichoic acid export membrane protein
MAAAVGGALGLGLYLLSSPVALAVFHKPELRPVLAFAAVAIPLRVLLAVAAASTRASQRMAHAVLTEDAGQPAANLLLLAAFAWLLGLGLGEALWAMVVSLALAALAALLLVRRLLPRPASPTQALSARAGSLLRFSLPASAAATCAIVLIWTDRLMVGAFRPAAELGLYQAASQTSLLFAIILSGFGAIFPPMMAALHRDGGIDRIAALYRASTKWGLYLCLAPAVVLLLAPREVLTVMFGSSYTPAWMALVILTLGQLGNAATGQVGQLLVMTGHPGAWFAVSASALTANVVMNLLLVPRWGMLGAAVATAVCLAGMFVAGVWRVHRLLGLWPYHVRYLKGLAAALAAGGAVWSLGRLELSLVTVKLALLAIAAAVCFLVSLWLLGADREDSLAWAALRERLSMAGPRSRRP